MAHHTARGSYQRLVDRLNRLPQGAAPSQLLYRILELLFSEREAELVSLLPIKPFTAAKAARIWKLSEDEALATCETLAARGLLVDIRSGGRQRFVLPPPMAGFFEFSLMRVRSDVNQKVLSELFHQYITVEDEFMTGLFEGGTTQLGRTFVHEEALATGHDHALHVLDYERASHVVETASHIGIGLCYCRHKMEHMGAACEAPLDICMTFNNVAESLTRHGIARAVDRTECLDLLQQARDLGLVQFGENVQRGVGFICNCCGCCCEALIAARRFGFLEPVHTTNFLPVIDLEACNGCGQCVNACPVEAMSLVSANDPQRPRRRIAHLDERICLGCGVCVPACQEGGLKLEPRPRRVVTPVDSVHKIVMMAIERGQLANLLFDDRTLASHRALGAVLGAILGLPPVKRALASRQVQSLYVNRLIERAGRDGALPPTPPA